MNRLFRIRRYNKKKTLFDVLFPQTVTSNILRRDDGGVLESYLQEYDRHLINARPHLQHAVSRGTHRHLKANIRKTVLVDGFPLLLRVHTRVECEPTLDFNHSGPKPILSGKGERIPGGQEEGTTMFLIFNEDLDAWTLISCDNYSDITKVLLPVERDWTYVAASDGEQLIVIPDFDCNTDRIKVNYKQTILRPGLDYVFNVKHTNTIRLKEFSLYEGDELYFTITKYTVVAKQGSIKYDLIDEDYVVEIQEDGTTEVRVPQEAVEAHSIEINYRQTILRNNLDFNYSEDGRTVHLKFPLKKGEKLVFTAAQFVEGNGSILPNNWGATGNYRYSMNVLREKYVAEEDKITVIPVPNYNKRRDDLFVVRDNICLIYDVDYTIDTLGQVVLLTSEMNTGDEIHFTILQGAMLDVPNFNVIDAAGPSGQHILLNMSYDQVCNFYTLLVRLKHDLQTAPTAKCIDGPAEPILNCFGNPVMEGYVKGSFLWLVYSEDNHAWYSLGHGQLDISKLIPTFLIANGESNFMGRVPILDDYTGEMITETIIEHGLGVNPVTIQVRPIEPPGTDENGDPAFIGDIWSYADEKYLYVGNTGTATSKFAWTVSNQDKNNDLRTYLETELAKLKARPGNIYTKAVVYTATQDGTTEIPVEGFNSGVDKLLVNYGQTVLREGIDFEISPTGITLTKFALRAEDIIQFVVVIQADD